MFVAIENPERFECPCGRGIVVDLAQASGALCGDLSVVRAMQISEAAAGSPAPGAEPCRFPKLEECAHFHYERVHLPAHVDVHLHNNMDQSLHSHHANEDDGDWYMIQVTSGDECWLLQRNFDNFRMLDAQLHQCIFDRKISQLADLATESHDSPDLEALLMSYLERLGQIVDNSLNCGPVLNWLQMDNKGHRLLVPSEESRSINTPAVAAAYSVRRYVSQAHDELNLEVGDMISVIDMASPGESVWWRGKRGFQVGFFPQHCVHIIGDKVPRNMPLPPPVVGSLAVTSIKPVLRRHGKLITFFRSFILNRPSRRRLKQSGILRERVFACDLGEHLLNSGHEIPTVLKCCAEFIETSGIVDGIYRLSGITSNIQKLRNAFDEDRVPNLYTDDILQDIHSVASLLKMYFRELPNPLCTYQLYQSFVNAVQGTGGRTAEDDRERLLKMRETVQKLPPPHYRTLEYLMRHLARVAKHGPRTGMTTRNVAIVWAPNLLRCAELEDGGVTALQGVGVQAVVTEFLICFADLIFCDRLPNFDRPAPSPKSCRPKSLAISTPTKLITLEEARSKHHVNRSDDCKYIEVGGGPKNLPKKYHTVIELPSRKRGAPKRSPSGWRSFFSKSRGAAPAASARKNSTPALGSAEAVAAPAELAERRRLRTVKSAESLTSGLSEPAGESDSLGPLHATGKPPGHNRSVSHDSYFDTLQSSQNNSEGSMLDLSEIQLNFDLEETEMRIFSEDESLVSSPKVYGRRILTRARPEDFSSATNSGNPSPKKQARVALASPDPASRKRTRLEDQLSDIQYIDCGTPENVAAAAAATTQTTQAVVHAQPPPDAYRPKNKSPRNSDAIDAKRHSMNVDAPRPAALVKSRTEADLGRARDAAPRSPTYRPLGGSSNNTTSDSSPAEITYETLDRKPISPTYENVEPKGAASPTYENILTTISITYKSPTSSKAGSPVKSPVSPIDRHYENIAFPNPEKVVVPTSTASLPDQQASQPELADNLQEMVVDGLTSPDRPGSPEAADLSSADERLELLSSELRLSATDLSLSEVLHSSTEDELTTSLSLPTSPSKATPNVSPNPLRPGSADLMPISPLGTRNTSECSLLQEIVSEVMELRPHSAADLIEFSPLVECRDVCAIEPPPAMDGCDSSPGEVNVPDSEEIYQQVKILRRSIHEVNELLRSTDEAEPEEPDEPEERAYDSLENDLYEIVNGEEMRGEEPKGEDKLSVKDLLIKFGECKDKPIAEQPPKGKKSYEREALPPCVRARNLRHQIKTRSLDEDAFKSEFAIGGASGRRKSMDDGVNGAPKALNPPKCLPLDRPIDPVHLAHSAENVEDAKKRERIEKYKEERRKYLQEKYRTESFKQDKDVVLSRLKMHKKDEPPPPSVQSKLEPPPPVQPKVEPPPVQPKVEPKAEPKPSNLKARAAVFENHSRPPRGKDEVVLRERVEEIRDRRRHTFETRERETETERLRRISVDNKSPRRDKAAPAYCIKDMKAIFESKSKQ